MYKRVNAQEKARQAHEELMEVLRALTDETRQQILTRSFNEKEVCVNDIASRFTLSRPTISHHLNLMKRAKILNARKEGKEVYYSVNKTYLVTLLESFLDNLKHCC